MKIEDYFKELERRVKICYDVAENARRKGYDPKSKVEVPLALSLAERVAGLVSTIYPQLNNPQLVKRIKDLEKEVGSLDPAVSLKIAEEVAKEKFCKFKSLEEGIDAGIRVALAYFTLGVVSSPIEGYTHFELKKTKKGEDYFSAYFSGPIRSAGGTAAAFSLVIIDYLRDVFGFVKYDPTEEEVKRAISELYDYHERVTNLQYLPTEKEIELLAGHLPIQVNGDPSEDKEVSNYKDLERVETNFIRSGFCLVLGEGIAQKAPKILKMVRSLREKGFKLREWDFLEKFVELQKKQEREKKSMKESAVYIKDLVAGRPVLGHPSRSGAFRLRYGRARNSGYSCLAIHPASMAIFNGFIAIGSQIKIEMPTKGGVVAACDSIEGPIVKLRNGSVRKIKDKEEARSVYDSVEEIIYSGDLLVPYGDFLNRNHMLAPSGYCEQEWYEELKEKEKEKQEKEEIENIYDISFEQARKASNKYDVALHPKHIYYWSQISYEQFLALIDWLAHSRCDKKLILPYNKTEQERFKEGKRTLELLGIDHEVVTENVLLNQEDSKAFLANLGLDENLNVEKIMTSVKENEGKEVLEIINELSKFKIKDKAGTFVGARMGRPEKAKLRKLTGSPNVLFPVGYEGGRLRSVNVAYELGAVKADFPIYFCDNCKEETVYFKCEKCDTETRKMYFCPECKQKFFSEKCPGHFKGQSFMSRRVDMKKYFDNAIKKLDLLPDEIPNLVKGVRGTSNRDHIPENLAKGLLRAIFNLQVNKDGTIRYDATEMPLTHFKPKEIGTSIERLREMGYEKDVYGKELANKEQILEILPHDIILPSCPESGDEGADDVFLRISSFLDSLLIKFYGLKSFYNSRSREDLLGKLIACIAPHNCAAVVGRIIGFSKTQALLASPYIHAAMRRDCLSYESYVSIKREGNWQIVKIGNFVEKENPIKKADNFGTLKKNMHGIYTLGNPGTEEILEVTKHKPRKMLKIYLEDGRKIEVTENHKIYTKAKKEKRARNLKHGDKLMVGYKKDIQEKDIKEIFLPEIFKDKKDIVLRNIRNYLAKFENLSKHENFYQRDSFPIKFVEEILRKYNKTLQDLPSQVRIAIKRDNVSIPIKIPLDSELLEVIGLYIAEGFLRKKDSEKGFYQVSIVGNAEIKNLIKKVFFSHFNLKPSEDFRQVTFSSRIIYELFKDYLKIGSKAKEKRIPSLFLNLKKDKLAALLRGYFEGDGSVSLTDIRVTCDTISEGLKYDLSFVLSRFGIFTKFYKYKKKPGTLVREFYLRKNRKIPEFETTKIIIPSPFIKKFKRIGFISERKSKILDRLCNKTYRGMKIDFDENYAYPKIIKIEEIKEKKNYCFNVPLEHNFFANDILVHNCDGDEAAVMLLLDLLINFSREYLPAHRGGTQDAPLVLNARIKAGEVDDMVFDVDIEKELPLELYEKGKERKHPSDVKIDQIRDRIGRQEFRDLWYSYEVSDINNGVLCSTYKKLATMQEKVQEQMRLAEKLRAVSTGDVARLIIDRHFMRDIRGNLRKFSQQVFRCSKCNEKYRRPPLTARCLNCNGNIIFTISEGFIVKYLDPATQLADKYDVPSYIKQSLDLTRSYIESIFGKEKEKQEGLGKWFG